MAKHLCDCGKVAIWIYMPGYSGGHNPYSCDDCVPRGCSCNFYHANPNDYHPAADEGDKPEGVEGKDWKWIERQATEYELAIDKSEGLWVYLDEKGRESPCVEFEYDEDGFDIPTFFSKIVFSIEWKWFLFKNWLSHKLK